MINNFGIFWFRQDLRLQDNLALNELVSKCDKIIPIYIFDEKVKLGGASKWWLHQSLISLNQSLKKKKSKLFCFRGDPEKILEEIIYKYEIKNVHWNRLYDQYSVNRDANIKKKLILSNINVFSFKGSLINEPWDIKNKTNSFFKVFTPYWNACLEKNNKINLPKPLKEINTLLINSTKLLLSKDYKLFPKFSKWTKILSTHWVPGENQALENFNYFKNKIIENYAEGRDRPDRNFTSKLSPYLHFGEISPERILLEIQNKQFINLKSKKKYIAEIGWREFSTSLLFYYPDIRKNPIQLKFKKFPWENNKNFLKAWQSGQTGYPIVDAGMRQLYETGWMHNRVRMIVGSFLCKNLLIHWREGEKWFYDTLVDADLGSNSAGWQWIAGCGADAAPYFRIFNPITQGLKFDKNGEYVKKYVPEIRKIPSNQVHAPWELNESDQIKYGFLLGRDYPKPIVNLSNSRDKALAAFSSLKVVINE